MKHSMNIFFFYFAASSQMGCVEKYEAETVCLIGWLWVYEEMCSCMIGLHAKNKPLVRKRKKQRQKNSFSTLKLDFNFY